MVVVVQVCLAQISDSVIVCRMLEIQEGGRGAEEGSAR
jgi:hypothetical protein